MSFVSRSQAFPVRTDYKVIVISDSEDSEEEQEEISVLQRLSDGLDKVEAEGKGLTMSQFEHWMKLGNVMKSIDDLPIHYQLSTLSQNSMFSTAKHRFDQLKYLVGVAMDKNPVIPSYYPPLNVEDRPAYLANIEW